jgi:hypothetical protein
VEISLQNNKSLSQSSDCWGDGPWNEEREAKDLKWCDHKDFQEKPE